eukprot:scaffold9778_cov111-Isochrysis_galbana.AAC.5
MGCCTPEQRSCCIQSAARVPVALRLDGWPMARWKARCHRARGGRVLVVLWLSGRPMAHWKALSKGFPTVP